MSKSKINHFNLVARFNAKMLEKVGLSENQVKLAVIGSAGGDVEDIKDEIITESMLLEEEAKNFTPIQYVLDDFHTGQTYGNVKDDFTRSSIDKNPVYRQVKPRIGKMIINRDTGEREIVHDYEEKK
jgi:hypothetical protein